MVYFTIIIRNINIFRKYFELLILINNNNNNKNYNYGNFILGSFN